jgi:uncharacterized repeat protein (TIGR01451 family)
MPGRLGNFVCRLSVTLAVILASQSLEAGGGAARAQPQIDVRQRMPERAQYDEAVPIDIAVVNIGTAPAENVTVSWRLPAFHKLLEALPPPESIRDTLVWSVGSLAAGARRELHMRVCVTSGAATAELRSAVSVTFQTSVGNTCAAVIERPELTLGVNGPATGVLGNSVSFQINVANRGTSPAHEVTLRTQLPPGLWHPGGDDLENDIGTLAAGDSRTLTLPVTLKGVGDVSTRFELCARGLQVVQRQVVVHVQEIKIGLKACGPQLLYQSWSSSFDLVVRNEGSEVVRQAGLVAALPPRMAFVLASDRGRYDRATHRIYWDLGDLQPGEERTLLWNGVAWEVGEMEGRAVVTVGQQAYGQTTWKTRVAKATGDAQPAAMGGRDQQAATAGSPAAPAPEVKRAGWHPTTNFGQVQEPSTANRLPASLLECPKGP